MSYWTSSSCAAAKQLELGTDGSRRVGLIGQAVRVPRRNSWNLERMGRGGLFVALSRGWFRPICNTMGRGGSRPRAQREQREREQRETRNPEQPTPTTHPGKKYPVREPPSLRYSI